MHIYAQDISTKCNHVHAHIIHLQSYIIEVHSYTENVFIPFSTMAALPRTYCYSYSFLMWLVVKEYYDQPEFLTTTNGSVVNIDASVWESKQVQLQ